jgi:hypothetical protein
MLMRKLSGNDLATAKQALLQGDNQAPLEVVMQEIGTVLTFDGTNFDRYKENAVNAACEQGGFVVYPVANSRQFTNSPLSVYWNRPEGNISSGDDWIGLCWRGTNDLVTGDSYFGAWDMREEHGMVFWTSHCPTNPGQCDIVYYANNEDISRHPVEFVSKESMLGD